MSLRQRETLAEATRRVREALAMQAPPPAVQQALRAAFAAGRPAPTRIAQADRPAVAAAPHWWAAAACATLLVASTVLLLLAAPTDPAPSLAAARADAAFAPVAAAERWPLAGAAEGAAPAWLVAAEMPRERLAAWGLPFDPARAGEAVRAELLMRPSGEVLAVRVLHAAVER